jgi:hypothetical protein
MDSKSRRTALARAVPLFNEIVNISVKVFTEKVVMLGILIVPLVNNVIPCYEYISLERVINLISSTDLDPDRLKRFRVLSFKFALVFYFLASIFYKHEILFGCFWFSLFSLSTTIAALPRITVETSKRL